MADDGNNIDRPITRAEEEQLRRVFTLLCDYGAKKQVLKILRPKQGRVLKLRQSLEEDDAADLFVANELRSARYSNAHFFCAPRGAGLLLNISAKFCRISEFPGL